ncbi:MAG: tRNA-dihydrouridine synthase [Helicobacteraceae bacterium]|nr:tRNA-dihydrouridine synthase [Helicobacteraceae bacterium]
MSIARFDFSVKRFVLAPLAGWSDPPFRAVAKYFGADLTISEMISADALVRNPLKTKKLYAKSPLETPFAVQLVGSSVVVVGEAARMLSDEEGIDVIDLNAGCPAPKIARGGGGSALLKNPATLGEMIGAIKKNGGQKLTSAKIRLGFEKNDGVALAKVCEEAGADFITVHARTKTGGFAAPPNYEAIGEIKSRLKIPVIANGDIDGYEKAQSVFQTTNADGAMIGRAALAAPWIFAQLKTNLPIADRAIKREVVLAHFDHTIQLYGARGAIIFRKRLHKYCKGFEQAAQFRSAINRESDPSVTRSLIDEFFSAQRN